jgi:hypothetical protein
MERNATAYSSALERADKASYAVDVNQIAEAGKTQTELTDMGRK